GAEPPEVPILFFKPANTVTGPDDPVAIPRNSSKTDWEVELGVVIGSRAMYLDSHEQACEHIADFVTVNDFYERDFQLAVAAGSGPMARGRPGSTRSARIWSPPMRWTPSSCGYAAGSTASRGKTPVPRT